MEILVLGSKVDTKDIYAIVDIEANKKMFLNRQAGFIIKRINMEDLVFGESIPYESCPYEISDIKHKWKRLQNEVFEHWQKYKSDLQSFSLS